MANYNITVLDLLLHLSHFYTCHTYNVAVNCGKFRYNKDIFKKMNDASDNNFDRNWWQDMLRPVTKDQVVIFVRTKNVILRSLKIFI